MTSSSTIDKSLVEQWHLYNRLYCANWLVIDSVKTLTPRDSTLVVRRLMVSANCADTIETTSTELLSDTTASMSQAIQQNPFAAQSNKVGECADRAKRAVGIVFFLIILIFVSILFVIIKNFILSRRV